MKSLEDAGEITKEKYGIDKGAGVSPGADSKDVPITEPATPEAEKWDGWKTGLKPATEYIVMARKPFDGATVDCVLEHGTGALNIEGCRVGNESTTVERDSDSAELGYMGGGSQPSNTGSENGRYPSNVVFDETAAAALDEQVGELAGGHWPSERPGAIGYDGGSTGQENLEEPSTQGGGPSRYFYTSKASKSERTNGGEIANSHPTVKPTDLMEWLVRLVTREGQIVLDPFAGSGTTCMAAKELGREFAGIEKQAQWADVARARAGLTPENPANVRGDDAQTGLGEY
jgi:site-specific DNA-methyltransferase (adenine-specific)